MGLIVNDKGHIQLAYLKAHRYDPPALQDYIRKIKLSDTCEGQFCVPDHYLDPLEAEKFLEKEGLLKQYPVNNFLRDLRGFIHRRLSTRQQKAVLKLERFISLLRTYQIGLAKAGDFQTQSFSPLKTAGNIVGAVPYRVFGNPSKGESKWFYFDNLAHDDWQNEDLERREDIERLYTVFTKGIDLELDWALNLDLEEAFTRIEKQDSGIRFLSNPVPTEDMPAFRHRVLTVMRGQKLRDLSIQESSREADEALLHFALQERAEGNSDLPGAWYHWSASAQNHYFVRTALAILKHQAGHSEYVREQAAHSLRDSLPEWDSSNKVPLEGGWGNLIVSAASFGKAAPLYRWSDEQVEGASSQLAHMAIAVGLWKGSNLGFRRFSAYRAGLNPAASELVGQQVKRSWIRRGGSWLWRGIKGSETKAWQANVERFGGHVARGGGMAWEIMGTSLLYYGAYTSSVELFPEYPHSSGDGAYNMNAIWNPYLPFTKLRGVQQKSKAEE